MKYHADIYLPFKISFAGKVKPTRHVRDQARQRRFTIPKHVDSSIGKIVEVVTGPDQKPVKVVQRIPYSTDKDLCLVVSLDPKPFTLITAWLNNTDDQHSTLDRGQYACPTE